MTVKNSEFQNYRRAILANEIFRRFVFLFQAFFFTGDGIEVGWRVFNLRDWSIGFLGQMESFNRILLTDGPLQTSVSTYHAELHQTGVDVQG